MTHYELGHSPTGLLTFVDTDTGEYLHRFFGPEHESRTLYAEGCMLHVKAGALHVADVGLGAGFNVLATLNAAKKNCNLRHLTISSFDTTSEGLALLLSHLDHFPDFACFEEILQNAAACSNASFFFQRKSLRLDRLQDASPQPLEKAPADQLLEFCNGFEFELENGVVVEWNFYLGDAFQWIARFSQKIQFDAIFYDLFAADKERLFNFQSMGQFVCRLNTSGILATYSTSTAVRAVLLAHGLFVGEGPFVSSAVRATMASFTLQNLELPLDLRWKSRFTNSQMPFFLSDSVANKTMIQEKVTGHIQFQI